MIAVHKVQVVVMSDVSRIRFSLPMLSHKKMRKWNKYYMSEAETNACESAL